MEHGYIIVWYNCDRLPDDQNCETLEAQVKNLVENNGDKLIGVVYESLNVPVAISSWKHKLELDGFDSDLLVDFIVTYRLVDAPEPNAP